LQLPLLPNQSPNFKFRKKKIRCRTT